MVFEIKNNRLIKYTNEPEIKKIIIPNGIEIIDKYSFYDCHNIESIYIPESVRLIYWSAFENCQNLMSFSVDKNNAKFYTVNGCLYERLKNNSGSLVKVPEGMEYIEIPDTGWWTSAFSEYSKFAVINIYNQSGNRIILKRSELDRNGEYNSIFMNNVNQLIHNLDTSVHISRAVKTSIMMQMYFSHWSGFHDINNFNAVFKGIIDREETETIRKILDEGKLITKRNINTYIRYADENEHYSVFDMLSEYKEEVLKK